MPIYLHLDNYYLHKIALWHRDGYASVNREPECVMDLAKLPSFAILGENEPLRDALIEALEWDTAVRVAYGTLTALPAFYRWFNLRRYRAAKCHLQSCIERRDSSWDQYEVLRKLSCVENSSIRVRKFQVPCRIKFHW